MPLQLVGLLFVGMAGLSPLFALYCAVHAFRSARRSAYEWHIGLAEPDYRSPTSLPGYHRYAAPPGDRTAERCRQARVMAALIGGDGESKVWLLRVEAAVRAAGGSGGSGGSPPAAPPLPPPPGGGGGQPDAGGPARGRPDAAFAYRVMTWRFLTLLKEERDREDRRQRTAFREEKRLAPPLEESPGEFRAWLISLLEPCVNRRLNLEERKVAWDAFLRGERLESVVARLKGQTAAAIPTREPFESRVCVKSFPWPDRDRHSRLGRLTSADELLEVRDRVGSLIDRLRAGDRDCVGCTDDEIDFVRTQGDRVDHEQVLLYADFLALQGLYREGRASEALSVAGRVAERYRLPSQVLTLDQFEPQSYFSRPTLVVLIRQYQHWASITSAGDDPGPSWAAWLDERPVLQSLGVIGSEVERSILRAVAQTDAVKLRMRSPQVTVTPGKGSYVLQIHGERSHRLRVTTGTLRTATVLSSTGDSQ